MKEYRWATNIVSPLDNVDQKFLDTLDDYRIGPPRVAVEIEGHSSFANLVASGVFGVYTTVEAIDRKEVRALSGWNSKSLGTETLSGVSDAYRT